MLLIGPLGTIGCDEALLSTCGEALMGRGRDGSCAIPADRRLLAGRSDLQGNPPGLLAKADRNRRNGLPAAGGRANDTRDLAECNHSVPTLRELSPWCDVARSRAEAHLSTGKVWITSRVRGTF